MTQDNVEKQPPVPPFVRFVASAVPMVFDNSLSYYEAICAMWKYLSDTVNVINNNATVTEEYIQLTKDLKEYMDNYFDNLDVQEEINNKLDAMAEAGTLQEIIGDYLNATAVWGFDTVADMKSSTNLINGSYARTLGFHSLNDGGGALYKISNTGTANEMDVIAVGSLKATLVLNSTLDVKQLGAYGDNSHDDTNVLQRGMTIAGSEGCELLFSAGTYITDGLNTGAIKMKGINATLKAKSNYTTYLLNATAGVEISGLTLDGNDVIDGLLNIDGLACNVYDCEFKNCTAYAFENSMDSNNDELAYIENINVIDCKAGVRLTGKAYDDPSDYKGTVEFINSKVTLNNTADDNDRLYYFTKLNNVTVTDGEFTSKSTYGATNIYQVNHGNVIGGYYHELSRGVTLGQITKNFTVTNTINENIKNSGGLHIDIVTSDRVYPETHSIISNNIVKNAYRGMYIQGKNMLITDNYIYCGSNTDTSGGVIRFNNEDDNTTDSNLIVDNLYVYNLGSNPNAITCGTAVITLGKVYLDGTGIVQGSVSSVNPIYREHFKVANASGSTHVTINDDIIYVNASSSINIMLPNSGECKVIGKRFTIVRTDNTASTVSLRCRSDNGTINGLASGIGVVPIAKGVTNVVQTGAGEYWTLS